MTQFFYLGWVGVFRSFFQCESGIPTPVQLPEHKHEGTRTGRQIQHYGLCRRRHAPSDKQERTFLREQTQWFLVMIIIFCDLVLSISCSSKQQENQHTHTFTLLVTGSFSLLLPFPVGSEVLQDTLAAEIKTNRTQMCNSRRKNRLHS